LTSAITPKTGNTFVGEYGAVLDGSNWSTSDGTQAAFRAHNQDIDYVTIRNLVIKNMPQQGIHAYYWMSDHWTIEYNEIGPNKWGIEFAPNFTIRNNYIHHNVGNSSSSIAQDRGGAYLGNLADNTTFDSNEIAYNGLEQKVGRSANVTFRNNFVHNNVGDGIWFDSNANAGAVIDNNRVEDNGRNGIFFEASIGATISNNTVKRHMSWDGIFISMSQNAQIFNNTLEANFGGIEYFLNCDVLSGGDDVKNNAAHDNTVVLGTQSYTYASSFSSTSSCTSTQLAPYLNGSKNLTFSRDTYRVPSLSWDRYFLWGGWKGWVEWQVLGQDAGGSLTQ
jgi:parallel beta-helix repeat protein